MRETTYSLRTLMRTSVTSSGIRNLSFRIYSQFVVFRHRFFVSSSTRNVVYLLYAGLTQRIFIGFLKYLLCSFILRSMSFVVPILKMRSSSPIWIKQTKSCFFNVLHFLSFSYNVIILHLVFCVKQKIRNFFKKICEIVRPAPGQICRELAYVNRFLEKWGPPQDRPHPSTTSGWLGYAFA